jgi:threonylcarbamoyladenosine tRNA methylthiotransferase MtaB
MRTFCIQTLGCKVNQYESEQIATLLRRRGLVRAADARTADLRIINTCSVTIQAASKSRQTVRRLTRLPVLQTSSVTEHEQWRAAGQASDVANIGCLSTLHCLGSVVAEPAAARTVVTGCWATSNPTEAKSLHGVDAVIAHHDDVAAELERLLDLWSSEIGPRPPGESPASSTNEPNFSDPSPPQEPLRDDGSISQAGIPLRPLQQEHNKPPIFRSVKRNSSQKAAIGTRSLPLLDQHQAGHQRAFLKVQDGCDAHCSYCIIPQLRPGLWSKPVEHAMEEARRLVDAGHREIVLTGIFLGAYGQPTALRRRQPPATAKPLAELVEALCTRVPGLRRLRFSSLEPGDLTRDLLGVMKAHPQVVPHFHLPLQSGSDGILHRMNRQYTRDDFLRMIDDVNETFDRPAITTDVIVGFPGETDDDFDCTLDIVHRAKFIHIHAFSFSPRPGTAAARWTKDFVRGPVVNQRIDHLTARGVANSHAFRKQFLGEIVELLVEQPEDSETLRHGRSERYFDVWFDDPGVEVGDAVQVRIDRVTPTRTFGYRSHGARSS